MGLIRFSDEITTNEKKNRPSAWVIVYTQDKLILGKRSPDANNPNQWNFFGGGVDPGEDPAASAARELGEEAGYVIDPSSLKYVTTIGDAAYYSLKVTDTSGFNTTDEISKIKQFKLTDMPDNLHSKTDRFFQSLDTIFD